jgi:uncharacterized membrane protein
MRGLALLGMASYHGAWDLHAFGLSRLDPGRDPVWHLLGQTVAATFLFLSGVGLTLARRRGATGRASARRLLVIAAAAALVTFTTARVTPDAVITFGILHCIAATNLIALGLERLGTALLVAVAMGATVLPRLLVIPGAWSWSGLAGVEPATLDFRPILPWLGPVLLGMAVARRAGQPWRFRPRPPAWAVSGLAWAGRHSLALYLVHQPLMIGILVGWAVVTAPATDPVRDLRDPAHAKDFLAQCTSACMKGGRDGWTCTATCHCVLTAAVAQPPAPAQPLRFARPFSDPLDAAISSCRKALAAPD